MSFGAMVAPLAAAGASGGSSSILPAIASGVGIASDVLGIGSALFGGGDDDRQFRNDQFYNPIKVRVGDAKGAGIHPLFALGYQGGGFGSGFSGQPSTGSLASDALDRAATRLGGMAAQKQQRAMQSLQMQVAESQIRRNDAAAQSDYALAQKHHSDVAMATQRIQNDQANALLREINLDNFRRHSDAIKRRWERKTGVAWDQAPAFRRVSLGNGKWAIVPNQDVMETGEVTVLPFAAEGARRTLSGAWTDQRSRPSGLRSGYRGRRGRNRRRRR